MKRNSINEIDVYSIVSKAVDKAGGQRPFGRLHGISKSSIHHQLHARDGRRFSDDVLKAAGLKRVVTFHYEFLEN